MPRSHVHKKGDRYMIQRLNSGSWADVGWEDWGTLTVRCKGYAKQNGVPYRAVCIDDQNIVVVECHPK